MIQKQFTTIPKSFPLAGITITVELDPNLYKNRKIVGEAKYPEQMIILDVGMLHKQSVEHIFYHELIHWIFYLLNEIQLRDNEKLVDTMAYFLHQSIVAKGDCYSVEDLMPKQIAE